MQYLSSCGWLISLGTVSSRFIHVVANCKISFFPKAEWGLTVCAHHIFFLHSSVRGPRGCFHTLATENTATVITRLNISAKQRTQWTEREGILQNGRECLQTTDLIKDISERHKKLLELKVVIQFKNGLRNWMHITPKKTYKWPTGIGKDARYH